jgi:DNA helicase-2/ATP-dependent DNA helicase PcrA
VLATEHRSICVVGDSDQSIYRFRAADVRNILEFAERFPDATTIVLEQNFRLDRKSFSTRLTPSLKNSSRHRSASLPRGTGCSAFAAHRAGDEYDVRRAGLATELRRLRHDQQTPWSEMAWPFDAPNAASRAPRRGSSCAPAWPIE